MLDHNTNISNNVLNSCVRMVIMKPLSASVLWVKSQLAHTRRIETNNGFFAFKPRANRCAITRTSANRETLYTDECFMNHGTAALCKRLLETGKWLILAFGSRYECLIIKLHRLADNSTGGYGYNLGLDNTRSTLRGSLSPKFMKAIL
jgi:hypothetical protein